MKYVHAYAIVFIMLLLTSVANAESALVVSPISGEVPLRVEVHGPADVLDRASRCTYGEHIFLGRGGNKLTVDWGDGDDGVWNGAKNESCARLQTEHEYTVPGTYKIAVNVWHPGINDAGVTDWSGSQIVVVTGPKKPSSVKLLSPTDSKKFFYQEFPQVKWRLDAGSMVDLRIEMVSEDGQVLAHSEYNGLAFSGEGSSFPRVKGNYETYDRALLRGQTKFRAILTLFESGKIIASEASDWLEMSGEIRKSNLTLELPTSRQVTVKYQTFQPTCLSYSIDWGDKSSVDKHIAPSGTYCKDELRVLSFSHRYGRPGKYRIFMRTNEYNLGRPLKKIAGYNVVVATVTR